MPDLETNHTTWLRACNDLYDSHQEALHRLIVDHFPDAVSYSTSGMYGDVDGELSVRLAQVLADESTVLWEDETGEAFDDVVDQHLMWMAMLGTETDFLGDQTWPIEPGYQYVKLVAVLRLRATYHPADIQELLPPENRFGEVCFAATDSGYNGEFDDLGADRSSWPPL